MSKLSIFTPQWIDLVFENRNKGYGAYQLRKENPKTTIFSLFLAIAFVLSAITIFSVIGSASDERATIATVPLIDALVITDVIFPPKEKLTQKIEPPIKKATTAIPIVDNMSKPTVTKSQDATAVVPKNSDVSNSVDVSTSTSLGADKGNATDGSALPLLPEKPVHGNVAFGTGELDRNPEFPGGIKKFLSYVATNFKAEEDIENTIRVTVSFIVEKDGTMSNIAVRNNPGYGMGEEAIRVLKSMKTKWEPGIKDKQKVRAFYNLPITIKI